MGVSQVAFTVVGVLGFLFCVQLVLQSGAPQETLQETKLVVPSVSNTGYTPRRQRPSSRYEISPVVQTKLRGGVSNSSLDDVLRRSPQQQLSPTDLQEAHRQADLRRDAFFHHQQQLKKFGLDSQNKPVSTYTPPKPAPSSSSGVTNTASPAHELTWPPVDVNGNIVNGTDIMHSLNLAVPRFFVPPPVPSSLLPSEVSSIDELDPIERLAVENKWYQTVANRKVNGRDTIHVMISSFRDFQCRETVTDLFARAKFPDRIFVSVVDQLMPEDLKCDEPLVPCEQNPAQPLCVYRNQLAIQEVNARVAKGPVTARHIGDRMYRGESFVLQIDAHCGFVVDWDEDFIEQWRATNNEMAVLTTYMSDIQGSIDENGFSTRKSRPIMCESTYVNGAQAKYLRHGSQPETFPVITNMPQLEPFWAAGLSFSRGHFKMRVPYDPYMLWVFQGEEINMSVRGFTHGYDFYAPHHSNVFHEYASQSPRRKKVKMFWDNRSDPKEVREGICRAVGLISMYDSVGPYSHVEEEQYGVGPVRSTDQFYQIYRINTRTAEAPRFCPFVVGGKMHREFQPFLRDDGNGIDYTKLTTFVIPVK